MYQKILKILFSSLLILLLIGATVPMVAIRINIFYFQPVLLITSIVAILKYPRILTNKSFLCFYLYSLIIIIDNYFSSSSFDLISIISSNLIAIYLTLLLVNIITADKSRSSKNVIFYTLLLIIIFRCITGISVEVLFPGLARLITGGTEKLSIYYIGIGVLSYQFLNALPFIVSSLTYSIKSSNKNAYKIFTFFLLLLILASIYEATWGTAMIFSVLSVIVVLYNRIDEKVIPIVVIKNVIYISLLIVLIPILFHYLNSITPTGSKLKPKLSDIDVSLSSGTAVGQVAFRAHLMEISLISFTKNPIIGDTQSRIGGHSYFFDHLAMYGIIGTLLLIALIFFIATRMLSLLPFSYKKFYYLNLLLFLLFGMLKNMGGYEFFLFLLVFNPLAATFLSKTRPQSKDGAHLRGRLARQK